MRALPLALIAVAVIAGCRAKERPPRAAAEPTARIVEPAPVDATIGRGPRPVYPVRVGLDTQVRPGQVRAVPGTSLAAVSGADLEGPVLQLIDVQHARVLWTDRRWCDGRLVHASRDRLVCASGQGVRGVRVADGSLAWSSPRRFRAAEGERVLVEDAMLETGSGQIVRRVPGESVGARHTRVLCDDGDAYAWTSQGRLWRLDAELRERWTLKLARAPSQTDLCATPLLVELPTADPELRSLVAIDRETGQPIGEPIDALGWWPTIGAEATHVDVADERGIHRRTRALAEPRPIAPARVAGALVARTDELRLVRAVGGSLLLIDRDGLRAWLAAPAGVRAAVMTQERLLTGGRLHEPSSGELPQLYELPTAASRMAWPSRPLRPRPRARLEEVAVTAAPAPSSAPATEVAFSEHGAQGVAAVTAAGETVFVAVHDAPPGPQSGAGLAAFDLRTRSWTWYQADGCARDAQVVAIAVSGATVACATRASDPGLGAVVGVDTATGAVRWRRDLRTIDSLAGSDGRTFVATAGARVFELEAASGEMRSERDGDHGHAPRVVVTAGGPVRVEAGGVLVGPSWRLGVDDYVRGLDAVGSAVVLNLASGAVYAVDAASGAPTEVAEFSPAWSIPTSGDLFFDEPETPAGVFALRGYRADGRPALRIALSRPAGVVPLRVGANAPLLLIDDVGATRVFQYDAVTGDLAAVHAWPRRAFRRGAFSADVAGAPVVGVVLARPLAVHLF